MFEPIVSIDLGASYTKVAYRPSCLPRGTGRQERLAKVLVLDGSALIPTLAISTGNKKLPWVFGRAAAGMTPTADMEVFLNWKANLFRSTNDKESAEAVTVAGKFFGWMREQLEATGTDMARAEVRVAMPAFENMESKALLIARCMELNGWNSAKILKVTEPHANTIGLFSSGRNWVTRNPAGQLQLQYNKMFGQNFYMQVAREAVLFGMRNPIITTLMVDIGAFTTDIAALTFDTRSEHDGLADIKAASYPLGVINELDRPLFAALGARHGFTWSEISFRESELVKLAAYGGGTHSLLLSNPSRVVAVGGAADNDLVIAHTAAFADQVWQKVSTFPSGTNQTMVYRV